MNKGIFQTKLRTGDEVIVISGKDLGKKGTLREIYKTFRSVDKPFRCVDNTFKSISTI